MAILLLLIFSCNNNPPIPPTELSKRDTISERYSNGVKKVILSYEGRGKNEHLVYKTTYHSNEKIKSSGPIKNGHKSGTWKTYDIDGTLIEETLYADNGELIDLVNYSKIEPFSPNVTVNDPIKKPKKQTEKVITGKKEKKRPKSVIGKKEKAPEKGGGDNPFGGAGKDPFASGGHGGMKGNDPFASGGHGGMKGNDPRPRNGPVKGSRKERIRLKDPTVPFYPSLKSNIVYIHLLVEIDENGKVVSARNLPSKTTTTDQIIINDVIIRVKKTAKYDKNPGAPLAEAYITVRIQKE